MGGGIMGKFEIIARWIHSDSDEPISEIEWLKEQYKDDYGIDLNDDEIIKLEEE